MHAGGHPCGGLEPSPPHLPGRGGPSRGLTERRRGQDDAGQSESIQKPEATTGEETGAKMALVLPGPPAGSTSSAWTSAQTCLGRSTAGPGGGPGPWRMRGCLRERQVPMPGLLRDTETAAACSPRACLSPWRSLTRRRDRRGARNQVPAAKGLVESDPRTLQLCVLGQVTTPFCASVLSSIKWG